MRRWQWHVYDAVMIAAFAAFVASVVVACTASELPSPSVAEGNVCELEAAKRGAECAIVYAFAQGSSNELGHVEKCVPERYLADAERRHGPSWPSDSERFTDITQGLVDPRCFWCIYPGANALDGCWVP